MAGRQVEKLTAVEVAKASRKGMYPDGRGLYLKVGTSATEDRPATKHWIFRYMLHGRPRHMGLGPVCDVSLAQARREAQACRELLRDHIDPIEARKARRAAALLDAAKAMTFKECASAYIEAHKAGWRNEKHAAQWGATLETYAYPVLGDLAVQQVDVGLVLKAIEPIWATKTETATRVRGRIEAVLDWAKARGYREGENPARWRGHLQNILPNPSKVQRVQHHRALPYSEIRDFVASLKDQAGNAARALELLILTATRTGEIIGARWKEIDLAAKIWTIPPERMKGGREHRVSLSAEAIAVIEKMKDKDTEFVFPGGRAKHPLTNMAMLKLLDRMERADLTVHGFRSTFRDWAAELTNFPREVAEMVLAHTVGDKVEAAYRRGDLFEKRRRLMDAWATFCRAMPSSGKVHTLNKPRRAGS